MTEQEKKFIIDAVGSLEKNLMLVCEQINELDKRMRRIEENKPIIPTSTDIEFYFKHGVWPWEYSND